MTGKEMLSGIQLLDADLIEEAEFAAFPARNILARRKLLLPLLAAAVAILMMGCAIWVLHLENLRIAELPYTKNMHYQADGSTVPATEKILQYISVAGPEGSRNRKAAQEWLDYKQTAPRSDPDFRLPAAYENYGDVRSSEMLEKLAEICEKYGLSPAGETTILQGVDADLLYRALSIPGITTNGSILETEFQGTQVTQCGSFNAAYQAALHNPESGQDYIFTLIYDYRSKDAFTAEMLQIEDGENAQQWNLTVPSGQTVLIVNDPGGNAYILCDREDAFIDVTIKNVGWDWDNPFDVMTRDDLEQIAKALDFTVKPHPIEDMAFLKQLEGIPFEEDPAEVQQRMELMEANTHHSNYADLIQKIRDNESYFTQYCNVAYENFWDTMDYALLDITGDGQDELILGRDGHINEIWTIRDGITTQLQGSYSEGYLCQGQVFEHYVFLDGKPYHHYSRLGSNGYFEPVLTVEYRTTEGSWFTENYEDETERKAITEAEAREIIAQFPRIPVEMTPVREFPID